MTNCHLMTQEERCILLGRFETLWDRSSKICKPDGTLKLDYILDLANAADDWKHLVMENQWLKEQLLEQDKEIEQLEEDIIWYRHDRRSH